MKRKVLLKVIEEPLSKINIIVDDVVWCKRKWY